MLSKGGNNQILAVWGEGNDPNVSVFGALDSADQTLRDETIRLPRRPVTPWLDQTQVHRPWLGCKLSNSVGTKNRAGEGNPKVIGPSGGLVPRNAHLSRA